MCGSQINDDYIESCERLSYVSLRLGTYGGEELSQKLSKEVSASEV